MIRSQICGAFFLYFFARFQRTSGVVEPPKSGFESVAESEAEQQACEGPRKSKRSRKKMAFLLKRRLPLDWCIRRLAESSIGEIGPEHFHQRIRLLSPDDASAMANGRRSGRIPVRRFVLLTASRQEREREDVR